MGRIYTLAAENMSLGTGNVLAGFQTVASASAGAFVAIHRIEISQSGSTTSAMIRAAASTRDTAGTLTTSSTAPLLLSPAGGPASAFAGNTNILGGTGRSGTNSSADSGGTYTNLFFWNFNNLNGMIWVPTPPELMIIPPSVVWVIRLLASPATTTGWTVDVVLEELV